MFVNFVNCFLVIIFKIVLLSIRLFFVFGENDFAIRDHFAGTVLSVIVLSVQNFKPIVLTISLSLNSKRFDDFLSLKTENRRCRRKKVMAFDICF